MVRPYPVRVILISCGSCMATSWCRTGSVAVGTGSPTLHLSPLQREDLAGAARRFEHRDDHRAQVRAGRVDKPLLEVLCLEPLVPRSLAVPVLTTSCSPRISNARSVPELFLGRCSNRATATADLTIGTTRNVLRQPGTTGRDRRRTDVKTPHTGTGGIDCGDGDSPY